jgi:pimeloyl-ACP methyl ester carboxylesterase
MMDGSWAAFGPGETVRLNYYDWGPRMHPRRVVCVHGLTRQGRDFDELAKGLSKLRRIVCPDLVGRGRSGWLTEKSLYTLDTYAAHMAGLLDHLGFEGIDWVGTSLGGLIGMRLAAEQPGLIRRLVLNDIGPELEFDGVRAIAAYVGQDPRFRRLGEVAEYLKTVHADFGRLTDAQWSEMTTHSVTRHPEGGYGLHYDPAIGAPFRAMTKPPPPTWSTWERIECPVLLLRGENSRLLSAATAARMAATGPKAEVVTIKGVGHAPALMSEDQIAVVREFLTADDEDEDQATAGAPAPSRA